MTGTPRAGKGDPLLIAILAGLSVVQFGWIFWPSIGTLWTLLNASILAALVICGLLARAIRSHKRTPIAPCRAIVKNVTAGEGSGQGGKRPGAGVDSEVDYFALANLLITQYGIDARAQAARLMQDALREDDPEATADWRAIEHVIALLSNDAAATRH